MISRNSFTIPDTINPYEVLKIPENSKPNETKRAFRKLVTNPIRSIRAKACLAYDIICNKKNYIKSGDKYRIKTKDHWYYCLIGDLDNLKKLIQNNKYLIHEKDSLGRTLLYQAARNGYYNIVEYLLKQGSKINEIQNNSGSTALHGAAFYEQEIIVQLLLEYGANTQIKNKSGALPSDDAFTISIKNNILNSEKDEITIFCNDLIKKGLARKLEIVKYNGEIIGKRILRSDKKLPKDFDKISKSWNSAWHGTKYRFLESIMKYGLYPSGSKLENGYEIKPLKGHVQLKQKLAGFDDWAKAIFVSPSIFYAGHPAYARKIISDADNEEYSVLIETRLRPGSYSKHPPTVEKYTQKNGEPKLVEYRIKVKDDSNLITKIESINNVIVTGILFAKTEFLKNTKDYDKGDIFVNSKEEHSLFLTQN